MRRCDDDAIVKEKGVTRSLHHLQGIRTRSTARSGGGIGGCLDSQGQRRQDGKDCIGRVRRSRTRACNPGWRQAPHPTHRYLISAVRPSGPVPSSPSFSPPSPKISWHDPRRRLTDRSKRPARRDIGGGGRASHASSNRRRKLFFPRRTSTGRGWTHPPAGAHRAAASSQAKAVPQVNGQSTETVVATMTNWSRQGQIGGFNTAQ